MARQSAPNPTLAKAVEYHKVGQFERALKNYRRVLKQEPSNAEALVLGGQAAFQTGNAQQGIRWLKKAAKTHPNDPRAPYNLGVMYQQLGETHNALDAFQQAAETGPNFAPAHYNLAMSLNELGRHEVALPHLDRAIEIEPNYAEAHAAKAYVLRGIGKVDEAIEAYQSAVRIAPDNAKAWVGLGTCLQEAGRIDEALAVHHNAIKADPDYPDAAMNLCDAFVQAGKAEEGIRACDDYLARHPGDSGVLAAKSIALNEAGRKDELAALVDLERLVRPLNQELPAGFKDIAAFNKALSDHVTGHPSLVVSPASHTTRQGKQTGILNRGPKGPIAVFETLIARAIDHYMESVSDVSAHPVVAHRPKRTELSIWATVLEGEGYQAPHIHPSGWLSGVYYARVPKVAGEGGHDGWIEFGQPGPEYHYSAEPTLRLVKPEPGLMVMFPSYVFHRTVPFESDETRISVAFDVVPA